MKKFVAAAVLLLASPAFGETLIISAVGNGPHEISLGFSESSFDYNTGANPAVQKTICFVGHAKEVCAQLAAFAQESEEAAADGAHDLFTLTSCTVEGDTVSAAYTLEDDYKGFFLVDRKIGPCGRR